MDSGDVLRLRQLASPPPAQEAAPAKGGRTGHRSRGQSAVGRPQPCVTLQHRERTFSIEEPNHEMPTIVCEIFSEDLSYRVQSRKLLWEFFD
jgi:hypothetical protein